MKWLARGVASGEWPVASGDGEGLPGLLRLATAHYPLATNPRGSLERDVRADLVGAAAVGQVDRGLQPRLAVVADLRAERDLVLVKLEVLGEADLQARPRALQELRRVDEHQVPGRAQGRRLLAELDRQAQEP